MTANLPTLRHPQRRIGRREFNFDRQIAVMAVVNRTPDSFYDRGATFGLDAAIAAAIRAADYGADWVDIGGVKFAPGPEIPAEVELDRVLPVVAGVVARSDVVVSVDTFRADVADACIRAGAGVINDTTNLSDPDLLAVVAASDATLVIAHSLAAPRTVYSRPEYDDVVAEVVASLEAQVQRAVNEGVPESRIVIDPGHDLNKNTFHSLELTRRFKEIAALGLPAMAAVSNKDFIGEVLDAPRGERVEGSLAAATVCAFLGARIVRMHNVVESVRAMRMTEAILGLRSPVRAVHNMGDLNADPEQITS